MKSPHIIIMALIATVIIGTVIASVYFSKSTTNPIPSSSPTINPTSTQSTSQISVILNGAGATFPQPLLNAMISQFCSEIRSDVQVNYDGVGSGKGLAHLASKTTDFSGSDAPLSVTDMEKTPNVLHIPETVGAVTVAYNLPGISTGLHLTGKVIADIFQGKITMWNNSEIQSKNPDVMLPAEPIQVVHRSESSGTTFIFTGYLSTEWNNTIGQGKTVVWSLGIGANGNPGVAAVVEGTPYMIGYVELAYALEKNMTVAAIQNPAGNWVLPTLSSTQEAMQSMASGGLPAGGESWADVSLINTSGEQAYPIVSFTYLLVYQELNVVPGMTQDKATALVQFLWWIIHDGQQLAPSLEYAMLPSGVVQMNEATIQSITFNGQHLPTS